MPKAYTPASEFLRTFIGDEQRTVSEAALGRLFDLMRDEDASNRDWATFLLAQEDFDTPGIREALLRATKDGDANVCAEAVLGLARRDPHLALPFVQAGLRAEMVQSPMLEAAKLCAHPSLIADLRIWAETSDWPSIDEMAADALAACEQAAAEGS